MAESEGKHEAEPQARVDGRQYEERSITGSGGLPQLFLEGAVGGAGLATGKVIVEQIVQQVTKRPAKQDGPKIELPPGTKTD